MPDLECMYDSSLEGGMEVANRNWQKSVIVKRFHGGSFLSQDVKVQRTHLEWEQVALEEQICTVKYRCLNSILGGARFAW